MLSNGARPKKGRKLRGPSALKQMLTYLLPLVGRRIVLVLLLAVARTALSNRLARIQVSSAQVQANVYIMDSTCQS